MKKVIAIASFVMLSTGFLMTSCEPSHKTTNPDNMSDSLNMQNNNMQNNGTMDSTVVSDTTQVKQQPGK